MIIVIENQLLKRITKIYSKNIFLKTRKNYNKDKKSPEWSRIIQRILIKLRKKSWIVILSFPEKPGDFFANFTPNLTSKIIESIVSLELYVTKTNVKP